MRCLFKLSMSSQKKHKEPQIFVFEDPEKKYLQKETRISRVREVCYMAMDNRSRIKKKHPQRKLQGIGRDSTSEITMRRFLNSVTCFTIFNILAKQALSREERNEYELEKIGAIVSLFLFFLLIATQ